MKQNVIQNLNFEDAVINEEEKKYISKSGTIARYHKGTRFFLKEMLQTEYITSIVV